MDSHVIKFLISWLTLLIGKKNVDTHKVLIFDKVWKAFLTEKLKAHFSMNGINSYGGNVSLRLCNYLKAAIVMTNCVREQDQMTIGHLTTPVGYQQITRDMNLSRKDARLQLVRFRFEDIHRSVPVKVVLLKRGSYKNCFIDILFVGMRNTKDFSKPEECEIIGKTLQQLEKERKIRPKIENIPHRILFAEIYMRFSRNYTPRIQDDWSVSFYKINSFDVLNYNAT